jgi:hypothetical protein
LTIMTVVTPERGRVCGADRRGLPTMRRQRCSPSTSRSALPIPAESGVSARRSRTANFGPGSKGRPARAATPFAERQPCLVSHG